MLRPNWALVVLIMATFICLQLLVYYVFPSGGPDCSRCAARKRQESSAEPVAEPPVVEKPKEPLRRSRFQPDLTAERAKAAIVILARNGDVDGLKRTIPMFEKRFNSRFHYPYVFLNDVPFTAKFKEEVRRLSPSSMEFGTIPTEHWSYPSWINVTRADEARADMERRKVIYGGSLSYRHMCRYNSGFFFRHPLLQEYEYYWRVEPWVEFFCDIEYDPFMFMKKNDKQYGFVIMLHEYSETIPTLWKTSKKFMEENPTLIEEKNSLDLIQNKDGTYNGCHFWSNFEIASLKFLQSPQYLKYFDYLDQAGGFFYERWGDAPVHSIAVAMYLDKEKIHYFEDIGYYHNPFYNCPANPALQLNCNCDPGKNVNIHHECFNKYQQLLRS